MLDSDIANPKYTDAGNPDRQLHVVFKEIAVRNGVETEKAGRPVFTTELICVQTPPGGLISVPELCTEYHKQRFPFQWQQYQNSKGVGLAVQGTPLEEWPALEVGQRESLRAAKFYTVEQIANASDLQVQTIGMGGMALRQKAAAWLQSATDSAVAQRLAADNAKKDEENKALQARLDSQQAQIDQLLAAQPAPRARTPKEASI